MIGFEVGVVSGSDGCLCLDWGEVVMAVSVIGRLLFWSVLLRGF